MPTKELVKPTQILKKNERVRHELKPHQEKAVKAILKKFEKSDRTQVNMACGTGKTLTALHARERYLKRFDTSVTVVMVPTLLLLAQVREEWEQQKGEEYQAISICSQTEADPKLNKLKSKNINPENDEYDAMILDETEIGDVSTDVNTISDLLKNSKEKHKVIFCTYQSSDTLAAAINQSKAEIDLGIFDEAHKMSGVQTSFGRTLNNDFIAMDKRLVMTATPRIVSERLTDKANLENKAVYCMDDTSVYGEVAYSISFRKAIEMGLLCDYQVLVPTFYVHELLIGNHIKKKDGLELIEDDFEDPDCMMYFQALALLKVVREHPELKKIISFHSLIDRADKFAQIFRELCPEFCPEFISGAMKSKERKGIMNRFKDGLMNLLANSRVLTEGIDVKNVSGIFLADPKNSLVDIIQAVGRAVRLSDGKDMASIVVPLIMKRGQENEQGEDINQFENLINVVSALAQEDQILAAEVSKNSKQENQKSKSGKYKSTEPRIKFIANGKNGIENILQIISIEVRKRLGFEEKTRLNLREKLTIVERYCSEHKLLPSQSTIFEGLPVGGFWVDIIKPDRCTTEKKECPDVIVRAIEIKKSYLFLEDENKYENIKLIEQFCQRCGHLPSKNQHYGHKQLFNIWESIDNGDTNLDGDHPKMVESRKIRDELKLKYLNWADYEKGNNIQLLEEFCDIKGRLPIRGEIYKQKNMLNLWDSINKGTTKFEGDHPEMVKLRARAEHIKQNYLSQTDFEKWGNIGLVEGYYKINGELPDSDLEMEVIRQTDHYWGISYKKIGDFWYRISTGKTKLKEGTKKLEDLRARVANLGFPVKKCANIPCMNYSDKLKW